MTPLDMSTGQNRTRPVDLLDGHTHPLGCVLSSCPVRSGVQSEREELLTLRGGFIVDDDVLTLAVRLEGAGCRLVLDAGGSLEPIPPTTIPSVDRRLVAARWSALSHLVAYAIGFLPDERTNDDVS